ncbi:hypothetical protein DV517_56220 [Streptomyces sp. S816]|uniref:hypothetical protein n=1 Tax=Streptomyces sp. S816 TaxID=2283197 RepID=UPI00113A8151|nr:hypothetical protein [Streptomyces sp. S816]TGZ14139.1 hypothetical protein DV517_56220 [Streptomyces sp. S816]
MPEPGAVVGYDSPDLSFVVARHAVRELRRTTVVSFTAAAPTQGLRRYVPALRAVAR